MGKILFKAESEVNTTPKILFPYINTAALLEKWFADEVTEDEEGNFTFIWDGIQYPAKKAGKKENQYVKFEFLEEDDPGWVEFRIEVNQLTNATYFVINDYSEIDNEDDLQEMYNHSILQLQEVLKDQDSKKL